MIFFAVDITGGFGDRGFFKPARQIRTVTYEGLVNTVEAAREAAFTGRFMLLSGIGSELPSCTGRLLNAVKGNLQGNQRDRDAYLRNSGLDWSIARGAVLTNGPGGRADIHITPPVHRLSMLCHLARPDFARVLIAAADAPVASRRVFDVFNRPGIPPTDEALTGYSWTSWGIAHTWKRMPIEASQPHISRRPIRAGPVLILTLALLLDRKRRHRWRGST